MTKTRAFFVAAFGLMILAAALWEAGQVRAIQSKTEYVSFGMVGVARGQTLRLNVVNAVVSDPRLPPNPCNVVLTLVDGTGTFLAESSETLFPGQAAALNLDGDLLLTGRGGIRAQVRAYIKVTDESRGNKLPPGPCLGTLEVFDNGTGKTTFLHPGTMLQQSLSSN